MESSEKTLLTRCRSSRRRQIERLHLQLRLPMRQRELLLRRLFPHQGPLKLHQKPVKPHQQPLQPHQQQRSCREQPQRKPPHRVLPAMS